MKLTGDKLDYAISEYVNGTLNEMDRRALEEQLLVDAEARLHVTHEAHLTNLLREMASVDQPAVDFDAFGAHLSAIIADEDAHVAEPVPMRGVWIRRLAIAAVVGLMGAVSVLPFLSKTGTSTPEPSVMAFVERPSIETSSQPAEIHIAVGPSDALVKRGQTLSMADETIFSPSPRVVISTGAGSNPIAMDIQPLY